MKETVLVFMKLPNFGFPKTYNLLKNMLFKPTFTYRLFFFVLPVLTCTFCQQPENQTKESTRPNILFIMSDDHTSQAWGIYGGILDSIVQTPNIRRMAQEGALLQNVFCTNSICVPSRGSILTSQYSHQNGIYTLSEGLSPKQDNVAKVLQGNGYQTAIIGKWHLKEKPAGFDYYNVLPGQGRYQNSILRDSTNWEAGGETYKGYSADVIADQSINWLNQRNTDEPFFLMTHFKATHEPFDYPARHANLYEDIEVPEPASLLNFYPEIAERTFSGQELEILGDRYENNNERYPGGPFSLEGLDSIQARKKTYQKFVKDFMRGSTAIDDNIGKLLDYLDEKGLADNTIVIYTADQGYFLGEHGFFDKRMMYEEALRMPFVVRYPPEIEAGSQVNDMILNLDFAPLFLDYAGVNTPEFMEGESFRTNLTGNIAEEWRSSMYYRYWLHQTQRPAHFGIRTERYKLIFYYGQPLGMPGAHEEVTKPAWEFYDLKKDPAEIHNAYHDPAYQETIQTLKQQLLDLKQEVGDEDAAFPVMQEVMNVAWDK